MRRIALALALAACATPYESPCTQQTEIIALDAVADGGVSADGILDFAEGDHRALLTLVGGTTTPLTVTVTWRGDDPAWASRDAEALAPNADASAEPVCVDALLLPVEVRFTSDDGAFDERWSVVLEASDPAVATFEARIDARRLGGAWELPSETHGEPMIEVTGVLSHDGGTSGTMRARAIHLETGRQESWAIGAWTPS